MTLTQINKNQVKNIDFASESEAVAIGLHPTNLRIVNATTSDADDSIKLTGLTAELSATNIALVPVRDSAGKVVTFEMTSDVTILLSGAHWERGDKGDLADAILIVGALNDSDTLKWGVVYHGGRQSISSANTSTTQTDIITSEMALVNSTLSGTAQMQDHFWFRVNFSDSSDVWAVQSGANDLNMGTGEGEWQMFNPAVTGISNTPGHMCKWSRHGKLIVCCVNFYEYWSSDSTSKAMKLPVRNRVGANYAGYARSFGTIMDNGSYQNTPGYFETGSNNSLSCGLYVDFTGTPWTASGDALWEGQIIYPAAD